MKRNNSIYGMALRVPRLLRDRAHALKVLLECQGALDATGSYSPVRLAACIKRLARPI